MEKDCKLIIGLGNPDLPADRHDKKYLNTYHNVGFLFIDFLRENYQLSITPCLPAGRNYQLLKSNVYMNLSGSFVIKAMKKNNIKPTELLIVHDDSDLIIGKYKLSFGSGAAGHHGVESIISSLKTQNFWRLRIGVRPQNEKIRQKADMFVLKKISTTNKNILKTTFAEIQKALVATPE